MLTKNDIDQAGAAALLAQMAAVALLIQGVFQPTTPATITPAATSGLYIGLAGAVWVFSVGAQAWHVAKTHDYPDVPERTTREVNTDA